MRAGDVGDEAAGSAEDAERPPDFDAVRADDDLIEALSAGLVPPPSGSRDPSDVESELVALLSGWVADIRPESLLHQPADRPPVVGLWTPHSGQPAVDSPGGSAPELTVVDQDGAAADIPRPRIPSTRLPVEALPTTELPVVPSWATRSSDGSAAGPCPVDVDPPTTRIPVVKRARAEAVLANTGRANTGRPNPTRTDAVLSGDTATAPLAIVSTSQSLLEYDDHTQPISLAVRRARRLRPHLVRAAAAVMAVALVSSGLLVRTSYDAHPGEPLWVVAQMVFPAKSRSVEAACVVSTALNTARVALERGRIGDAQMAFQSVQAQLGVVEDADGRGELNEQTAYLTTQLDSQLAVVTAASVGNVRPGAATNAQQGMFAVGTVGAVIKSTPTAAPGATVVLSTPPTPVLVALPVTAVPGLPSADPSTSPLVVAAPAPAPAGPSEVTVPAPPAPPAGPVSTPPVGDSPANSSTGSGPTSNPSPTTDPPVVVKPLPVEPSPTTQAPTSETTAPAQIVDSATTDTGPNAATAQTEQQAQGQSVSTTGATVNENTATTQDTATAAAGTTIVGDAGLDLGPSTSAVSSTNSGS